MDLRRDLLVETDWLAEHLDDPAVRAINVQGLRGAKRAPSCLVWLAT